MNDDSFARLILQITGVFVGGGAVQFLIFLLRRRSELAELDAKADATLLDSATHLVDRLRADADALRGEVRDLRSELDLERQENARRLAESHRLTKRLGSEVARLKTDLDIARAHIHDLQQHL